MSQFVVFATPAFDHTVTLGYLGSWSQTIERLRARGIDYACSYIGGDPYLAKVRNALVSSALKNFPQMTDFFFLDADIEWDPDAVLKLLDHPADVVAGIYPKKNDTPEWPCELLLDENKKLIEVAGWYRAGNVPTGFLRIKRHVLERFAAQAGRYIDGTNAGIEAWNIFEMGFCADNAKEGGHGEWWGEDYAWGRKWLLMGGELWINPDITFGHRGGKTWRGNFRPTVEAFQSGTAQIVDRTNVVELQKKDSAA